jgi:hypothetical protein
LCGSTRFSKAFTEANLRETLAGNIVLTVGSMMHSDGHILVCSHCGMIDEHERYVPQTDCPNNKVHNFKPIDAPDNAKTKKMLDALHFKKIELSDEILVLNVIACKHCKRAKVEHMAEWFGWVCSASAHPVTLVDFAPYIGESTRNEIRHAIEFGKKVRFLNPHPLEELAALGIEQPTDFTVRERR